MRVIVSVTLKAVWFGYLLWPWLLALIVWLAAVQWLHSRIH